MITKLIENEKVWKFALIKWKNSKTKLKCLSYRPYWNDNDLIIKNVH